MCCCCCSFSAPATASKEDNLEYDVGNLMAYDPAPIAIAGSHTMHSTTTNVYESEMIHCRVASLLTTDLLFVVCVSVELESRLASLGRDNAQLLFNKIFELPTETLPHDMGKLALLPKGTTALPREKPIPKPAAPTKWEAFAKLKGIEKKKRGRMVYDEAAGVYAPRFGYKSIKQQSQDAEWAIDAPSSAESGSVDPWTQAAADKKARIALNKKQNQRNLLRSAEKGSKNRAEGAIDLKSAVELSQSKLGLNKMGRKKEAQANKKPKHHVDVSTNETRKGTRLRSMFVPSTDASSSSCLLLLLFFQLALGVVQRSTASMGNFDTLRTHEPSIVLPKSATNRALRHDASERSKSRPAEKGAALHTLSKVLTGQKDNDNYGPTQRVNMEKIKAMGQQDNERKNIDKKRKAASDSFKKKGGASSAKKQKR